jgi:hypothetical protein
MLNRYEPILSIVDNYECRPTDTKFHWNPSSSFGNGTLNLRNKMSRLIFGFEQPFYYSVYYAYTGHVCNQVNVFRKTKLIGYSRKSKNHIFPVSLQFI